VGLREGRDKRTATRHACITEHCMLLPFITQAHLGAGINPAMSTMPRFVSALSGGGAAALAGCAILTIGPLLGGLLGGCVFALSSGHGKGFYAALSRIGRVISPWYPYGELCEPQPVVSLPQRGVVVPTRLAATQPVTGQKSHID